MLKNFSYIINYNTNIINYFNIKFFQNKPKKDI